MADYFVSPSAGSDSTGDGSLVLRGDGPQTLVMGRIMFKADVTRATG